MSKIIKPRGTIDILPDETGIWQRVEAIAASAAGEYGFKEIRFPTFEMTELFSRGVGGTTDIVQKEMYTFGDKDGRSMTLRPEGTACVVRSVIENGLYAGAMPLKLFYKGSFFRYEKPQAGRTREFTQFGAELYGSDDPSADATVIMLADSIFKKLNIQNYTIHINSIGCENCRPAYRAALVGYFTAHAEKLCSTCVSRLETNPLRILDCKSPQCGEVAAHAPETTAHLCGECGEAFAGLSDYLKENGLEYIVDSKIVRGLDYYTRTVFEFIKDGIGAQSTICGGGRYNGLFEELGGPPMSAVGFGMGISRLIPAIIADNCLPEQADFPWIYIAPVDKSAAKYAFSLAEKLRRAGIRGESDIVGRSLKAQMKYADKAGADFVLVLGGDEIQNALGTLHNMKSGEKTAVSLENIEEIISLITAYHSGK